MRVDRELSLKIRLVRVGLISRVLILAAVIVAMVTHFITYSRFWQVFYLVLPLSCLYFILFGRFVFINAFQYLNKGRLLSSGYVAICYYGFLLLNIAEFTFIILETKYLVSAVVDFFLCIAVIETASSVLAGLYIVDLFGKRSGTDA